jgi:hypothetical protein
MNVKHTYLIGKSNERGLDSARPDSIDSARPDTGFVSSSSETKCSVSRTLLDTFLLLSELLEVTSSFELRHFNPSPDSIDSTRPNVKVHWRFERSREMLSYCVELNPARPDSIDSARPDSIDSARPDSIDSARPDSIVSVRPNVKVHWRFERSREMLSYCLGLDSARPDSIDSARPDSLVSARPDSKDSARPDRAVDFDWPDRTINSVRPNKAIYFVRPELQMKVVPLSGVEMRTTQYQIKLDT